MSFAYSNINVPVYAACVVGAVVLLEFARRRKPKASRLPLPPGPQRMPIIGNLHQMPPTHLWEKASEWAKTYGDLIYVENLGIPMLFINSYEIAYDLLDKRSAIYSSRPPMIIPCELQGWDWITPVLPYGETLRKHRTHLQRFIQSPEVLNYVELQQRESYVLLNGLLNSPDEYDKHVRRLPGSVILKNVYGYEVKDKNDPLVQLADASLRSIGGSFEYFILDCLPWLKFLPEWFPGVKFQKVAREGRQVSTKLRSQPHVEAKRQFMDGAGKECMTSILLAENMLDDGSIRDEKLLSDAAATVFLGGSDTSTTTIMTFFLAMLKNPDQQRRAQEEIDRVIGPNRLPELGDRDSLPYVQALCNEVLRWEMILPTAFPHYLTEDDEYNGFHIPAGTIVFANSWAISRDPNRYADPLAFKPERWLPGETTEGVPNLKPQEYVFGYGRRICPGRNWAEHIVFIAVSSILATFNIEKVIGPDGGPIPPNDSYQPSAVRSLGPSRCKITPRSEKAASLIRHAIGSL